MSTRTSWSNGTLTAALSGAALFGMATLGAASVSKSPIPSRQFQTRLPVLEESVVISAPAGYCIDRLGSLSNTRNAFVLLASCRITTGNARAPEPIIAGLLTASVDGSHPERPFPSEDDLQRFFTSAAGLAALSRHSNPAQLSVGRSYMRNGAFYVHILEGENRAPMGGQSWRAVFEVNGRMVTATLRDIESRPIRAAEGFRTVEAFVDGIVAASRLPE